MSREDGREGRVEEKQQNKTLEEPVGFVSVESVQELCDWTCRHDESPESIQSQVNRRKVAPPSFDFDLYRLEMLSSLSAKQLLLNRKPTLIDNLISRNRSALLQNQMEGKSGSKPKRGRPDSKKEEVTGKRKASVNGTSGTPAKKARREQETVNTTGSVQKKKRAKTDMKNFRRSGRLAPALRSGKVKIDHQFEFLKNVWQRTGPGKPKREEPKRETNGTRNKWRIRTGTCDDRGEGLKPAVKKKRRKRDSMWVRGKRPMKTKPETKKGNTEDEKEPKTLPEKIGELKKQSLEGNASPKRRNLEEIKKEKTDEVEGSTALPEKIGELRKRVLDGSASPKRRNLEEVKKENNEEDKETKTPLKKNGELRKQSSDVNVSSKKAPIGEFKKTGPKESKVLVESQISRRRRLEKNGKTINNLDVKKEDAEIKTTTKAKGNVPPEFKVETVKAIETLSEVKEKDGAQKETNEPEVKAPEPVEEKEAEKQDKTEQKTKALGPSEIKEEEEKNKSEEDAAPLNASTKGSDMLDIKLTEFEETEVDPTESPVSEEELNLVICLDDSLTLEPEIESQDATEIDSKRPAVKGLVKDEVMFTKLSNLDEIPKLEKEVQKTEEAFDTLNEMYLGQLEKRDEPPDLTESMAPSVEEVKDMFTDDNKLEMSEVNKEEEEEEVEKSLDEESFCKIDRTFSVVDFKPEEELCVLSRGDKVEMFKEKAVDRKKVEDKENFDISKIEISPEVESALLEEFVPEKEKEVPPDADSTSDLSRIEPSILEETSSCDNSISLYLPNEVYEELKGGSGSLGDVLPDSTQSKAEEEKEEFSKESSGVQLAGNKVEEVKEVETKEDMPAQPSQQQQTLPLPTEESKPPTEEPSVERQAMKEAVLKALGLKSLNESYEKPKPVTGYTGTLKAVIKVNRGSDKKSRTMVYRRSDDKPLADKLEYRICSEPSPSTDAVSTSQLNELSGHRKQELKISQTYYDGASCVGRGSVNGTHKETDESEESKTGSGKESSLVIPEKSSSFSIHPGRLCSDVCSYCFGKFGSLDTPCHVAQLKGPDKQRKILQNEPHLTVESCLCDACYRYVDRKANYGGGVGGGAAGGGSRMKTKPPAVASPCCVSGCVEPATHTVKRKWLLKLKKSISNKLQIDLDKHAGVYYPLCAQHHYWVDYFTVCGICRKRLNRNHLYSLGAETDRLNLMLAEDGIPARLSDKLFLCKLCRYYSNLRLKYSDPMAIPSSNQPFYRSYRKKILISLDIAVSDSEEEGGGEGPKKKLKKVEGEKETRGEAGQDEMALRGLATLLGDQPEQQARIQVKFGNVNIGTLSNLNIGQGRGGGGGVEEVGYDQLPLTARLDFEGPSTPDGSWERVTSTVQFDRRTKRLWQELQRPYGNQSSFLRHLVILEKYWRSGFLSLAEGADPRAAKYINGVRNRLKAFDGGPQPVQALEEQRSEKLLITNTGEIEVTPITGQSQPKPQTSPQPHLQAQQLHPQQQQQRQQQQQQHIQQQQRYQQVMHHHHHQFPQRGIVRRPMQLRGAVMGHGVRARPPTPQSAPPPAGGRHLLSYQEAMSRAKALVRMAPPPPLLRLPRPPMQHQLPQPVPHASITLHSAGITIEKQVGPAATPHVLPPEKPSISVFREPYPH